MVNFFFLLSYVNLEMTELLLEHADEEKHCFCANYNILKQISLRPCQISSRPSTRAAYPPESKAGTFFPRPCSVV